MYYMYMCCNGEGNTDFFSTGPLSALILVQLETCLSMISMLQQYGNMNSPSAGALKVLCVPK